MVFYNNIKTLIVNKLIIAPMAKNMRPTPLKNPDSEVVRQALLATTKNELKEKTKCFFGLAATYQKFTTLFGLGLCIKRLMQTNWQVL